VPLRARNDVDAEAGERVRNRLRVAGTAEGRIDATAEDRREELLEVEPEHDVPAAVRRRVRHNRASSPETVRCVVRGNRVENLVQDEPLDALELALRALDHARRGLLPRVPAVAVVAKLLLRRAAFPAPRVCEPFEAADVHPCEI